MGMTTTTFQLWQKKHCDKLNNNVRSLVSTEKFIELIHAMENIK